MCVWERKRSGLRVFFSLYGLLRTRIWKECPPGRETVHEMASGRVPCSIRLVPKILSKYLAAGLSHKFHNYGEENEVIGGQGAVASFNTRQCPFFIQWLDRNLSTCSRNT
jgi:hypothetical protein